MTNPMAGDINRNTRDPNPLSAPRFERSVTDGEITRRHRGAGNGMLPRKQRSVVGSLPEYKRTLHLGLSTSNSDAWDRLYLVLNCDIRTLTQYY